MLGQAVETDAIVREQGKNSFRMLCMDDGEAILQTQTILKYGTEQHTTIQVKNSKGDIISIEVPTDALVKALRHGGLPFLSC